MKCLHLSDLHLGKKVHEYSMLEDQAYILRQILSVADLEKPDAVFLCGDIYDKSVPPVEAVQLFDHFLVQLAERKLQVFIISGNHDSSERIAFGSRLMDASGIHFCPVYDGKTTPVTLQDQYGDVHIYMLPFLKPAHVRKFFEEETIESYTDALRCVIREMQLDPTVRNILLTHQFVAGSVRSDSETPSVGGTDAVDVSVFADFDYTALGHIHRPQNCLGNRVRYCGTPLKYSFSELQDEKNVTVVELSEKGATEVRTVPLVPLHDMAHIKGEYSTIIARSFYQNTSLQEDYTHITLTDEDDIPDAINKLRTVYHRLMLLDYDNLRTQSTASLQVAPSVERTTAELFADFFEMQNGQPMKDSQKKILSDILSEIGEEEL